MTTENQSREVVAKDVVGQRKGRVTRKDKGRDVNGMCIRAGQVREESLISSHENDIKLD